MCVYVYVYTYTHTHTMKYYPVTKKNEILPLATTWIHLEGIMLSEISQTEKDIPYAFIYMWNLRNKRNEQTNRNSLIHRTNYWLQ